MSRRTTPPGKHSWRERVFVFGISLVFLHGITSSLLLEQSNCLQIFRIVDFLGLILIFLAVALTPLPTLMTRLRQSLKATTHLKLFGALLCTYSLWIIISGLLHGASIRETFLALLFDTALFWSFFVLVGSQAFDRVASKRILRSVLLSIGALSAIACLLYILGVHDNIDTWLGYGKCTGETTLRTGGTTGWLRSRGFVRNPNELGALLVMPLTLLVGLLFTAKRQSSYAPKALVLVSLEMLLIFTFSRSAWLAAAVALVTLGLLDRKVRGILFQPKILIMFGIGIVALGMLLFSNGKLIDELILHRSGQSNSTSKHWTDKSNGTRYIAENPLGTGPGSSGAVGAALKDGPSINTESAYLDVGAQYGVFGLFLVVWMTALIVRLLLVARSSVSNSILAGFMGLVVSGLLIPVWSNLTVTLLAGILLGLGWLARDK